jgi:hypothetical protein
MATTISITPGLVLADATARVTEGVSGATITAGCAVCTVGGVYQLARNTTAALAACTGIALNAASAGQALKVCTEGLITIGGTTAVGVTYVVGDDLGLIQLDSDTSSGEFKTIIGMGYSVTQIYVHIQAIGTVMA